MNYNSQYAFKKLQKTEYKAGPFLGGRYRSFQPSADSLSVWAEKLVSAIISVLDTTIVLIVAFQSLSILYQILPINV